MLHFPHSQSEARSKSVFMVRIPLLKQGTALLFFALGDTRFDENKADDHSFHRQLTFLRRLVYIASASAYHKKAVVNSKEITSTRNHTLGITQLVRKCCLTNKSCLERYKMVFSKE